MLPSLTLTVILATPVWPAMGVTVTVRLPLLPPKLMFAAVTKEVLSEAPDKVKADNAVSGSAIVNGIALVTVLTAMTWLLMDEIVGG